MDFIHIFKAEIELNTSIVQLHSLASLPEALELLFVHLIKSANHVAATQCNKNPADTGKARPSINVHVRHQNEGKNAT